MDFGTQDNEMRTSGVSAALSYGGTHLTTKESSGGGEKRRLGNFHNGTPTGLSAFTATHQTLDHHHPLQPHDLVQPVPLPTRDPDPDRVIGSTTVAPSSAVTKSKSTPSSATVSNVRYRECLKNHAANIGGNVFDGCGEFMPCGENGTLEALKCAACECHRNFHRKEVDGETMTPFGHGSRSRSIMLSPLQIPLPLPSPHHHPHQKFSIVQPMSVAFGGSGGGGGTESSSEDLNVFDNADGVGRAVVPYGLSKKRFRTKFTAEQKVRMVEFAERVGWRIQKQDEEDVERFCDEVGVKRQVLRVWMHNNKNTVKKMQNEHHDITTTTSQLALENNNVEAQQQQPGAQGGRTDI